MSRSIVSNSLKGPSATLTSSFDNLSKTTDGDFKVLTYALVFGSITTAKPREASIAVLPFDSTL
jgi:hypothetical protein